MEDPQKHLQQLSDEYQKLQTELENNVEARQKLESQLQENKGVQKEFANLEEDANIYKLVGPVLLKQDKTEAVMAVDGRLEFIEKEMYGIYRLTTPFFLIGSKRIESQISEIQSKSEKKRAEIVQFQTKLQQQAAAATASASS
ncbi:KE2 family protein [Rasamsonia emersonii CBS 393.64]|uniref:KE2 family protein n=1 Tax=Rasamsonia emersonii (strain ATCC 16479 / CBS 393.64 / IMI 116815) TaxID=1408163 RepID=A0A0F4YUM6_RASE3|nr:KE2 family protein [Rasamsonia emersonii CBS 393.64]KKA21982.1 KE2 family protein [Rasamsonia emersonii CBS 393.64]